MNDFIQQQAIDYIMGTKAGDYLQKASEIFEKVQGYIIALSEKKGEENLTITKIGTVLTLSILSKVGNGKSLKDFSEDDWKEIAETVGEKAVLLDDQSYSMLVFTMYSRYIAVSVESIKDFISDKNYNDIMALSEELMLKENQLEDRQTSEVTYIEDCLWISLEAMIKLISVYTTSLVHLGFVLKKQGQDQGKGQNQDENQDQGQSNIFNNEDAQIAQNFTMAILMFAFEYGRYMLYKQENELLTEYIEHQYILDEELQKKYDAYEAALQAESAKFQSLIDNAFAVGFRDTLKSSVELARAAGVKEEEILDSVEKIDDFFM